MANPSFETDTRIMRQAIELARAARRLPYPNPWVGCVVVTGGKVAGQGTHHGAGTPHAEIMALNEAGARARGATLYVTLEPCCHFGLTPPCTQAILEKGVRRVVYALRDPNPAVEGKGAGILRRAGLNVTSGIMRREAAALNEVYLKYRATLQPFITVKIAATLDGKTATRRGESRWITGPEARRNSRLLRARHQAVLVGVNTVLADNPHLGPRISKSGIEPNPWRVIMDSRLRTPPTARVIETGRCIVACGHAATTMRIRRLQEAGAQVWQFPGSRVPLRPLLRKLAEDGIISLFVEGGATVLGSFFDSNCVDRVYWYQSPLIVGSSLSRCAVAGKGVGRLNQAWRLRRVNMESYGRDWLIAGNLSRWALAGPS